MKNILLFIIFFYSYIAADSIEDLISAGNLPLAKEKCGEIYHTDQGLYFFYMGKLTENGDSAWMNYKKSLMIDPKGKKADSALYLLTQISYLKGNYLTSIKYAEQFFLFFPQSGLKNHFLFLLGKSYLAVSQFQESEEELVKLLDVGNVDQELLFYDLAQVYEGLGKYDLSVQYYQKIYKKSSKFDPAHIWERLEDCSEKLNTVPEKDISLVKEKSETKDTIKIDHENRHSNFYCQIGAFSDRENALKLQDHLKEIGFIIVIKERQKEGVLYYLVLGGPYQSRMEAYETGEKLKLEEGLDFFIVAD